MTVSRVLHVLPTADDAFGGPGALLAGILGLDPTVGVSSQILTGISVEGDLARRFADLTALRTFRYRGWGTRLSVSGPMLIGIWRAVPAADVVVSHSLFNVPALVTAAACRARSVPWILAPHGSLDPYDVRKHARFKQALAPLWRRVLDGTTVWCVTDHELKHLETYGARPRGHVVAPPIGVRERDTSVDPALDGSGLDLLEARGLDLSGRGCGCVVSFVGRFDVKKGILRLLDAFDAAAGDEDVLVLAGSGTTAYESVVDHHLTRSRRATQVRRPGWLTDREKQALWSLPGVSVLASDDENFGMAVAEAMSQGVPVVVTNRVALADRIGPAGAGVVTEPTVESVAGGLRSYLADPVRRIRDGANGRRLVEDEFSVAATGRRYRALLEAAVIDDQQRRTERGHRRPRKESRTESPKADLARLVPHTARSFVRRSMNRAGLEISRDPFTRRLVQILDRAHIDTVVDVGANEGQYARGLRAVGYTGNVLSVEPLAAPFARLADHAAGDGRWQVLRAAAAAVPGPVTVHVAANSVSSSVLGMLDTHVQADPHSGYVGAQEVAGVTVDDLFEGRGLDPARTLLKIDVQGFEPAVLDGSARTLTGLHAVQLELSLVELYRGQVLMAELVARLDRLGFDLWLVEPGFTDRHTGRLLQCDGVFVRRAASDMPAAVFTGGSS